MGSNDSRSILEIDHFILLGDIITFRSELRVGERKPRGKLMLMAKAGIYQITWGWAVTGNLSFSRTKKQGHSDVTQ